MSYIGSKPANKPVVASDIDPTVITGQTALAVAPASTDEFLLSDAGVLKRLDASLVGKGKVLQVVMGSSSYEFTTTSSSYVDIEQSSGVVWETAITPSATSSKVLVIATIQWNLYGNGTSSFPGGYAQLLDNGDVEIAVANANASGNISTDQTDQWNSTLTLVCLNSPSTTSAYSYKIAYKAGGSGRFGILGANNGTRLTLIEIGA